VEKQRNIKARVIASVFIALNVCVFSFIAFVLSLFSVHRELLGAIILVFCLSVIGFLVLWIVSSSKLVRYVLIIPALCIIAGSIVIGRQIYIRNIPTVEAEFLSSLRYTPFGGERSLLAKLDNESSFKLHDNFPVLDGATALFPVYSSFVQAVYSEEEFRQRGRELLRLNRTDGAYHYLLEGVVDIIFCAEPSGMQRNQFAENGMNIKYVPIGKEAFVFFVNIKNPVNNLTIEDIQGIYSGRVTNWRELNGRSQRIRAFQRPQNSGSQTMLQKIMGDVSIMDSRTENVPSMEGIINQVAVYRNFSDSIGYSFLYFAIEMAGNEQIKLLSINGVYPSAETIRNNSYAFSDTFYAIYNDSADKNVNIEPFIEWILSPQGQMLISRTGYVPINDY